MAGATKRRSVRQAAGRGKRSIYAEPDTDDDFDIDNSEDELRADFVLEERPPKRRKAVARSKPQTRSKARSKQSQSQRAVGKPRKVNSKALPLEKKDFSGPSDGRIPNWTSLPVDILRDIFIFASQPIHGQAGIEAGAHVSWLLKTAHTCRAFALPALEAYYRSPSMLTSLHPHRLLELLRRPKDEHFMEYEKKVHSLYIDMRQLAYVAHNKPPFNLSELAAELPVLQHIEIMHPQYLPPYRPLKLQRWTFSANDLFSVMHERGMLLKSWRWSRDMVPKSVSANLYGMMTVAHESKVFRHLTHLVVCGFNVEDSSEPIVADANGDDALLNGKAPLPGLSSSIAKLPNLQDLTFISCDVIMNDFLQKLPNNMIRLELSNCLEVTSDMIGKFLRTSGSQIRELVLSHNPALNFSFFQDLGTSCPRLEKLKMDCTYYSEKMLTNDAEAFYDELLEADEIPTWPHTLNHLELVHASKWSADGAQNLFSSLVEEASELPHLRCLILHAHINIPWRDRVGFRDQWIERLQRVFKRHASPVSYMGSLRQFREWKDAHGASQTDEYHFHREDPNVDFDIQVQISPHKDTGETDVYTDSDMADTPIKRAPIKREPRRSKRVAESQVTPVSPSPTPESETDDDGGGSWRKRPERFIQGLCDVVDIRIDNQRPREEQYTEGDFLDSEVSGDEDYREGAEAGYDSVDEEGYAW